MPTEQDDIKKQKNSEEIFNKRVDFLVKMLSGEASEIGTPSIRMHVSSVIEIFSNYKLGGTWPFGSMLEKVNKAITDSVREFNDFKTISLRELDKAENDQKRQQMDQDLQQMENDAQPDNGKRNKNKKGLNLTDKDVFNTFSKNIKVKKYEFDIATKIVNKVVKCIEQDPKLKAYYKKHVNGKKKEFGLNVASGALSAITGGVSPILAISGFKAAREKYKEYKGASKKGKLLMGAHGLAMGLGVLTGGSGAMFGASLLGQKVNEEVQQTKNLNGSIDKNVKELRANKISNSKNGGEFSIGSLMTPEAQGSFSAIKSSPLIELPFEKKYDLEILKKENPKKYNKEITKLTKEKKYIVKGLAHGTGATGGNLETSGPTAIGGGMVAGEAGKETIKVIPKGKDPVVKELEETNKLLSELVQSNKDMMEDQIEENSRKGLAKKDTKAEKTEKSTGIFGGIKDKVAEKKGMLENGIDILKEKSISKGGRLLSKVLPGKLGKIAGGAASLLSDAQPVYVVNADEMGVGSDFFDNFKKKGSIFDKATKTPTKLATNASSLKNASSLSDIRKMPMGAERTSALNAFKASKIVKPTSIFGKGLDAIKGAGTSIAEKGSSIFGKGTAAIKGAGGLISKVSGAGLLGKTASKIGVKGIPIIGSVIGGGVSYASTKAEGGSTAKATGGALGGVAGGTTGAILGSALGPLGTIAGGVIGSMAGEFIGKKLGGLFEKQNKSTEELTADQQKLQKDSAKAGTKPAAIVNVAIKDDKSKLAKDHLSLLKRADKFKVAEIKDKKVEALNGSAKSDSAKAEEAGVVKADEEKTLSDKLSSIWEDSSKSTLSKIGSSASAGFGSFRSSIQSFGSKKSEFDISKLKEGTGSVAAKYESGGAGAGTISSGKGDFGGKSYGTHQFTGGALQDFVKSSSHAKEFQGLQKGSPEFDAAWKNAAKDPNFAKEQHNHIAKTHAAPQMDKLKKLGLNTNSKALQEMAFSTGVQYGPNSGIIGEAIQASGKDPSKLSTKEIISIVQDYKAATVSQKFKSSSGGVQAGVANRHSGGEKNDLLKIAQAEEDGTLPVGNPVAVKKAAPVVVADNSHKKAIVKQKNVKEGSLKNIKNNSTQGSEGTMLKNKEVASDAATNADHSKGTQQAINNISIGGSAPAPPRPSVHISTGDMVSYATRLAKAY